MLAIDVGILPENLLPEISVQSNLEEEVRGSILIGKPVLLFGCVSPGGSCEYVASGVFDGFFSSETELTFARIINVIPFDHGIACELEPAFGKLVHFISEVRFDAVLAERGKAGSEFDDMASLVDAQKRSPSYVPIAKQLGARLGGRCSFSGSAVFTGDGTAWPINPTTPIRDLRPQDCLFLHQELASAFNSLDWTVGPEFEILADCARLGAALETVNTSGKLLLPTDPAWWPDQTVLAWHRERFFDRHR